MALRLIDEEERLVYDEGEGWRLFYRRIPESIYNAIVRKCTNAKQVTNWAAAGRELFNYAARDWEGVEDENGTAVAFSLELAERLPAKVRGKIVELAADTGEGMEAGLKNSPTTPGNKPITTA